MTPGIADVLYRHVVAQQRLLQFSRLCWQHEHILRSLDDEHGGALRRDIEDGRGVAVDGGIALLCRFAENGEVNAQGRAQARIDQIDRPEVIHDTGDFRGLVCV